MSKRKPRFIFSLALTAVIAAGAACSFYKAQATKVVDQLNLDFPKLIRGKAEKDPELQSTIKEGHEKRLAQAISLEPQLASTYPLATGKDFRFIADHAVTKDHEFLISTLLACSQ